MAEDQRWQAVLDRAQGTEGAFVYGVESTGIYCRPSCPSRRPRRDGVRFFDRPDQAEKAGFRACKRCRPTEDTTVDPGLVKVKAACEVIDSAVRAGDSGAPTLVELSEKVGSSPFHLQRLFKRHLGISPRDYTDAQRLNLLKERLREGEGVTGSLYEAGYGSSSRLYERSDAQLGMTPATYAKGGKGMEIGFTIALTSLGLMLVAATSRGISAVTLGDDAEALESALHKEYPAAGIHRDNETLGSWVETIVAHIEGSRRDLVLPLDLQATAFQWRVWQELQRIPYGATATYSEVAEAIGQPTAVRAVARACASNRVSLVIPCHRVIREDGTLGGYRWGLERKEKLLTDEASRRKAKAS